MIGQKLFAEFLSSLLLAGVMVGSGILGVAVRGRMTALP